MAMSETKSQCSSSSFSAIDSDRSSYISSDEVERCGIPSPLGILPYQFEPNVSDTEESESSGEGDRSQTDEENFAGIFFSYCL